MVTIKSRGVTKKEVEAAQRKFRKERCAAYKRVFREETYVRNNSDALGRIQLRIDQCRLCGCTNPERHNKYTTMCVDCGKLYARYLKHGTKDSVTAGKQLLSRCSGNAAPDTITLITKIQKQLQEVEVMKDTSKVCKQCGRMLPIDEYRKYAARGKGIYDTSTGYHTVCRECENFNQTVNNAYRKPSEERTPKQVDLLQKAEELYKVLHSRGLEPKGRFAADVLGINKSVDTQSSTDRYLEMVLAGTDECDPLLTEGQRLLNIELTEEPDVYQEMVDAWRECLIGPEGRVSSEYLELFNRVAERIDKYEDEYTW